MHQAKAFPTPEELAEYRAKCEEVARKLYGIQRLHYTRWDDAAPSVRETWIQTAHMARVWWNLANHHSPIITREE